MRTPLLNLLAVGTLAALVGLGMMWLRPDPERPVISDERPASVLVCRVDVLDAQWRPVHKLCSDGRAYERTTGVWRDGGPVTPSPGVRM